jgi:DNA polymerase III delta subunit
METTNKICPRCGVVHDCPPVDVDKIVEEHANEMARQIDQEVMNQLKRNHNDNLR